MTTGHDLCWCDFDIDGPGHDWKPNEHCPSEAPAQLEEPVAEELAAVPPDKECEKRIATALAEQQSDALLLLREIVDEPFLATPATRLRAAHILTTPRSSGSDDA
jgi:hypothetical protein